MANFTTSDGVSLHYTDEGAGQPLLCLPGLTRNGRDFDFVAPHLAHTRLIRLDYRGRGGSGWADPATYTIPVEARDVVELLDHLGLDKVAILGTSRGGLIAMTLAALARDRLCAVALNDVGPVMETAALDKIALYVGRNPAFQTHTDLLVAWPALAPDFTNVPDGRFAQEIARLYDETPDGLKITYDPRLRDAVQTAMQQPMADLWPLFDALAGLPLMALRGGNSRLFSTETFAEMQSRRPDMIAATVPDRGHVPYLDEPLSLTALHQWLETL